MAVFERAGLPGISNNVVFKLLEKPEVLAVLRRMSLQFREKTFERFADADPRTTKQ